MDYAALRAELLNDPALLGYAPHIAAARQETLAAKRARKAYKQGHLYDRRT